MISPLVEIENTLVSMFDAINISVKLSCCCKIKALAVLLALTISNLSVLYIVVSNVVLSPRTIKLELIVILPFTIRLVLYLSLTINLFIAFGS